MKSIGTIKVTEQNSKNLKNSWRENTYYLEKKKTVTLRADFIIKNGELRIF